MCNNPVPFKRSYWVDEGLLLAGHYPGDMNPEIAECKLSALLDVGIRTIINLIQELETEQGYCGVVSRLAEERGISVECINMPIEDNEVPTREYMARILDLIDTSIVKGLPVYVHCWGGYGRTGTVVGCWLARHGIALGKDALEKICELRRDDITACISSPQTDAQRAFVCSWMSGE